MSQTLVQNTKKCAITFCAKLCCERDVCTPHSHTQMPVPKNEVFEGLESDECADPSLRSQHPGDRGSRIISYMVRHCLKNQKQQKWSPWHRTIIPTLGRWMQEDQEFQSTFSYTEAIRLLSQKTKQNKNNNPQTSNKQQKASELNVSATFLRGRSRQISVSLRIAWSAY